MHTEFKVWSNIFFLIPFLLSTYYHLFIQSIFILAVTLFSTLFHIHNEKKWNYFDKISATLLISFNFYLLYLSYFKEPYFLLAIFFVIFAFYFYFTQKKSNYNVHHSLWHLSSAIITILCIFAYVARI